jgi:hypothetical protein
MELALVLRELWGRKRWLALGVVVSLMVAVLSVYQVGVFPPKLVKRDLQYSSASVQAFVDSPDSFVGDSAENISSGIERATVFANLLASPGAMDLVGRYAGIPGDELWAAGPVDPTQQRVVSEPTATKRSYQISGETLPYRIEFLADPNLPIISIYTQAPTTVQALALANASVAALTFYARGQQTAQHIPLAEKVVIRTIGPANGGIVNGGIADKLAGGVFVFVFVGWCVLIMVGTRLRAAWRQSGLVAERGADLSRREREVLARRRRANPVPDEATGRSSKDHVRSPASGRASSGASRRAK